MIKIILFKPADQAEVKSLILAGLAEHWGVLDPSKNPDLNDIATFYADGIFLVAWDDDQIIGTGALMPRSAEVAEIVRMSVAAGMRRQRVGSRIIEALISAARERGFQRVILETTATWEEVVQFYLRSGFRITHYQDGDVYFELDLAHYDAHSL